ncbi:MAG: hypothetical protein GX808_02055 [Syntrophomonadaceae bacterium]|nr:hypothetical protein [Syntrophomonadaceae bacterium]
MLEKLCLESFVADIDKIISGELTVASQCEQYGEEYHELIHLAQLLTKTDYATEEGRQRVWNKILKKQTGEIEDEDLDMVAGGLNLQVLDEKNKKNGI